MFQYIVLASLEFQVLVITLVQPTFVKVSMSLRLKCLLTISNVVSTFHKFSVRYCFWLGCSKTLIVLALNHIFLASLWHMFWVSALLELFNDILVQVFRQNEVSVKKRSEFTFRSSFSYLGYQSQDVRNIFIETVLSLSSLTFGTVSFALKTSPILFFTNKRQQLCSKFNVCLIWLKNYWWPKAWIFIQISFRKSLNLYPDLVSQKRDEVSYAWFGALCKI